jgi:hypothetical protein
MKERSKVAVAGATGRLARHGVFLEKKPMPGPEGLILFYHHDRHVIWGATAAILSELLDALR